jgi:hypothetical protein
MISLTRFQTAAMVGVSSVALAGRVEASFMLAPSSRLPRWSDEWAAQRSQSSTTRLAKEALWRGDRLEPMNIGEARRVLNDRLAKLRALSYRDLAAKVDSVFTEEIVRDSERSWQLEIQVIWDDEPSGNIRLIASIDDGGLRAFVPLTDGFVKDPSGGFVGEWKAAI